MVTLEATAVDESEGEGGRNCITGRPSLFKHAWLLDRGVVSARVRGKLSSQFGSFKGLVFEFLCYISG